MPDTRVDSHISQLCWTWHSLGVFLEAQANKRLTYEAAACKLGFYVVMILHVLLNKVAQASQLSSQLPIGLWYGEVLVQVRPSVGSHISRVGNDHGLCEISLPSAPSSQSRRNQPAAKPSPEEDGQTNKGNGYFVVGS